MAVRIASAALALLGSGPWSAAAAPTRPNIVFIVSDDHGWTDYGFMGHPHVATPHLDALAARSLLFPRGYVPSSLCCPSLASLITGRYPHQHRITSNDPPAPPGLSGAAFHRSAEFRAGREVMIRHLESVPTLPRLLSAAGYWSLQTGKWWQGHYRHGGFTHGMTEGGRHGDQGLAIGRQSMQPVFDFIDQARAAQKPFFVWYAPLLPHTPHNPPDRLLAKYQRRIASLPLARYWAMIEWFDETCGALLAHLDQSGLAQNTIVVYLADNGWIQPLDAPGPAPKSKQSPYDGGLRTPLMICWPGRVAPARSDALASSIDLAPTLLRAVGLPPPADLPGVDLLDTRAVAARPAIFGACFTHHAVDLNAPAANLRWRWTIAGHWKLLVPAPAQEPQAEVELYDLAADPHEERNLAAAQPGRAAELARRLDDWYRP
jgi:uncharacterized sulfatase